MIDIERHDSLGVYVGVDMDEGALHAVALNRNGKRLFRQYVAELRDEVTSADRKAQRSRLDPSS